MGRHWKLHVIQSVHFTMAGQPMQRDKMHACGDIAPLEFRDKAVAADPQPLRVKPEDIQIPGVRYFRTGVWHLEFWSLAKSRSIARGNRLPAFPHPVRLLQLCQTHRSGGVRHSILEAGRNDIVQPRLRSLVSLPGTLVHAEVRHSANLCGPGTVVGDDHSAIHGGNGFGGAKAVGSEMTQSPSWRRTGWGWRGMGGIVYHDQAVPRCKLHDRVHVRNLASEVNWNNSSCSRSDGLLNCGRIDTQSI